MRRIFVPTSNMLVLVYFSVIQTSINEGKLKHFETIAPDEFHVYFYYANEYDTCLLNSFDNNSYRNPAILD